MDAIVASLLTFGNSPQTINRQHIRKKTSTPAKPAMTKTTTTKEKNILNKLVGKQVSFQANPTELEKILEEANLSRSRSILFWKDLLRMKTAEKQLIHIESVEQLFGFTSNILLCLNLLVFYLFSKLQESLWTRYPVEVELVANMIIALVALLLADIQFFHGLPLVNSVSLLHSLFSFKMVAEAFGRWTKFKNGSLDIFDKPSVSSSELLLTTRLLIHAFLVATSCFYFFIMYPYMVNYCLGFYILLNIRKTIEQSFKQISLPIFRPLTPGINMLLAILILVVLKLNLFMRGQSLYEQDSLQFIGDSLFCYYVYKYFGSFCIVKAQGLGHLFNYPWKEEEYYKASKNYKPRIEFQDDWLLLLPYLFSIALCLYSTVYSNYLLFFCSLFFFNKLATVGNAVFVVDLIRLFVSVYFLVSISCLIKLVKQPDCYLKQVLSSEPAMVNTISLVLQGVMYVFILMILVSQLKTLWTSSLTVEDDNRMLIDFQDLKNPKKKLKIEPVKTVEPNFVLLIVDAFTSFLLIHLSTVMGYTHPLYYVKGFYVVCNAIFGTKLGLNVFYLRGDKNIGLFGCFVVLYSLRLQIYFPTNETVSIYSHALSYFAVGGLSLSIKRTKLSYLLLVCLLLTVMIDYKSQIIFLNLLIAVSCFLEEDRIGGAAVNPFLFLIGMLKLLIFLSLGFNGALEKVIRFIEEAELKIGFDPLFFSKLMLQVGLDEQARLIRAVTE